MTARKPADKKPLYWVCQRCGANKSNKSTPKAYPVGEIMRLVCYECWRDLTKKGIPNAKRSTATNDARKV